MTWIDTHDPQQPGPYICWDGHWERRLYWTGKNWEHLPYELGGRGLRWYKRPDTGQWIKNLYPEPLCWRPDDPAWGAWE